MSIGIDVSLIETLLYIYNLVFQNGWFQRLWTPIWRIRTLNLMNKRLLALSQLDGHLSQSERDVGRAARLALINHHRRVLFSKVTNITLPRWKRVVALLSRQCYVELFIKKLVWTSPILGKMVQIGFWTAKYLCFRWCQGKSRLKPIFRLQWTKPSWVTLKSLNGQMKQNRFRTTAGLSVK